MRIYKPIRITTICFIICNIKCTTHIKCLYSACVIYRLGEHCKIIGKRLQNHVKYIVLVSQTIHARHQTSIPRSEAQYTSSFVPIGWFMAYIIELPCMLMHRPRKQELSLACACSVPITHTSADDESQPNEPQQRSELATHRGSTSEFSHHTVFIKAIFQKAECGERTHSSSKPHSGKQLQINRDTVQEWRAILGQTWKQTLSEF